VQTAFDLNYAAEQMAAMYTHVALLTSDALGGGNVAAGGAAQAVTYGAGGAAGPTTDHAAVDGIAWSGVVNFTLTVVATHVGLIRGGVVHHTDPLDHAVGPGVVPFVHGIGPSAS
jgi:hypothetical protein